MTCAVLVLDQHEPAALRGPRSLPRDDEPTDPALARRAAAQVRADVGMQAVADDEPQSTAELTSDERARLLRIAEQKRPSVSRGGLVSRCAATADSNLEKIRRGVTLDAITT